MQKLQLNNEARKPRVTTAKLRVGHQSTIKGCSEGAPPGCDTIQTRFIQLRYRSKGLHNHEHELGMNRSPWQQEKTVTFQQLLHEHSGWFGLVEFSPPQHNSPQAAAI